MNLPNQCPMDPELWDQVQLSRLAVKARARLLTYTLLSSLPFIAAVAWGGYLFGLRPHEVAGITCFHAMITLIFMFDTLRNAAHSSFARACEEGFVTVNDGVPVIAGRCRHRHLARLSFAIGGQPPCQKAATERKGSVCLR